MPLPVPKLDDRSFQDLVNETKRLIPRYCPEWTDHNVSDPGVTLIELFAYMVDVLLYRVNRVPQRNYIKWLEMLGIELKPPRPARSDITFYLTGPQPMTVTVPVGTEAGTQRTESQNSVTFSTDYELDIYVPTRYGVIKSVGGRIFVDYEPVMADLHSENRTGIWQDPPQPDDAIYFGYHEELRGHILQLSLEVEQAEAIGVDPNNPPIMYEYWDGTKQEWLPMYVESDTTLALNQEGDVVLHVPYTARARDIDNRTAFWIRCRAKPVAGRQQAYTRSPRLVSLTTSSLGGIIAASQVERMPRESLGRSSGAAGQEWILSYPPVLDRREGEHLEVEEADGKFYPWTEVDDFADSKPTDKHYTLDSITGVLRLGPTIRDSSRREVQFGAVPPAGMELRFTGYRTGGGIRGNVGANSITVLKSSLPYVARVANGGPAIGGEDAESLEMAMMRGPAKLRARSRAVTVEDYEVLAREATPDVGRARCVPPTPDQLKEGKGAIKVLLVPASIHTDSLIPKEELVLNPRAIEEVSKALDRTRLITSIVQLAAPEYRLVSVEADVRARKRVNKESLQQVILGKLYELINPANGGPDGTGWPWEQDLFESEIVALVQRVEGVESVEGVRLFIVNPADDSRTAVKGAVPCPPNGLLVSARHLVVVK